MKTVKVDSEWSQLSIFGPDTCRWAYKAVEIRDFASCSKAEHVFPSIWLRATFQDVVSTSLRDPNVPGF